MNDFKKKAIDYNILGKYLIILTLTLFFLELSLRIFSVNLNYGEKPFSPQTYSYKYFIKKDSWLHIWTPNSSINYVSGEVSYHNVFNELGHREESFKSFKENKSSGIKAVCLGDSFTEGDGAPYDSTWVKFLEYQINVNNIDVSFYNAGVCGSDVFYNFQMLKEHLTEASPDIVLECINSSDLYDVYFRGGDARFHEDGSTTSPHLKNWEVLYKYSFVFRAIVTSFTPFNSNLVNTISWEEDRTVVLEQILARIEDNSAFCQQNQIEYVLILMPTPYELIENQFDFIHTISSRLSNKAKYINLQNCMEESFSLIDINKYYWPINGHYNSAGYEIMANCIFTELDPYLEKLDK